MLIEPFKVSSEVCFLQARRFYRARDLPGRFLKKKIGLSDIRLDFLLALETIRDISGLCWIDRGLNNGRSFCFVC